MSIRSPTAARDSQPLISPPGIVLMTKPTRPSAGAVLKE